MLIKLLIQLLVMFCIGCKTCAEYANSKLLSTALTLTSQSYCPESVVFSREMENRDDDFIPLAYVHSTSDLDIPETPETPEVPDKKPETPETPHAPHTPHMPFALTNITSALVGISHNLSAIAVILRVAIPLKDWIIQSETTLIKLKKCKDCRVGEAYLIQERLVIAPIAEKVKQLKTVYPNYKVLVTGHGVGGALATLAAVDMADAGVEDVSLVNFGSPRVGNAEFAAYSFGKLPSSTRVTHYQDFAPHYPSSEAGYAHIAGKLQ